jgi:hypothetical protein
MSDEQDEPVMAGSDDASIVEKTEGIVAQVRADAPDGASEGEVVGLLRQRLDDAGIETDDAALQHMARWIVGDE